ncbi:MAG TPA: hypothetical protein VJX68_06840 [Candidatus Binatus sp.]|uniref:hypothetical protein n=1 Tax=Candidatus Binatus sp. TaxID=2811406 RepID=UPI002B4A1AB3|nr:hypothetical protein [Candidatus Binatus sp.]HKN12898.1 hypothetical protein [Candidatus Binatus sp.]
MNSRAIIFGRRLWWPACAVAALIILRGCAYSLVNGDHVNSQQAAKIETGIQTVRQLRFKQSVPLTIKTPNEAEAMMEADLMRDYTDQQLEADAVAGSLTGLYPAGLDLKAASLKLLKSQVAGFYDPHGKEMVLVEGGADLGIWNSAAQFIIQRDVVGEMLLAHELTHALQDQNFGLETSLDKVKDDDDRGLALKSVAEGDATIAGFAYAAGRMDDSTADALADNLKQLPQALATEAPDTPEGLSAPLVFQYSDGVRFVAEAYRRGGWPAVDALYGRPPQSSHQILHPELYFDSTASGPRIELAGYDGVMSGWKKADDDTYGELLLRVILERNLGKQSNEVGLAARWVADRMIILQESRGVNVIWMLAFSDLQTASHFAVVYETLLDRLLGDSTPHRIDTRSNAVLVVIGQGADYFDTLAPAIWNASTIETGGVSARIEPSATSADQ